MIKDEQLWKRLKDGEKYALELLFRRYHKDLYRFAVKFCGNGELAEDQIQDLFLKIWLSRESIGEVKATKTYLWTALRRRLLSEIQKSRKNSTGMLPVDAGFTIPAEEIIITDEKKAYQKKQLEKAMQSLSPRQREILYLKYYEGMSYEEIEAIMSISYQAARNYVYQALGQLKTAIPRDTPAKIFYLVCLGGLLMHIIF